MQWLATARVADVNAAAVLEEDRDDRRELLLGCAVQARHAVAFLRVGCGALLEQVVDHRWRSGHAGEVRCRAAETVLHVDGPLEIRVDGDMV